MEFEPVQQKFVLEAVKLAKAEYEAELSQCKGLWKIRDDSIFESLIGKSFQTGRGLVALEHGKLIGYLSFPVEVENQFGKVRGCFSPLYASAFSGDDRAKTASLLFEMIAGILLQEGFCSFSICKYAHDLQTAKTLVLNGFGIRCSDAVRELTHRISATSHEGILYRELEKTEFPMIRELYNGLAEHLSWSPVFFPHRTYSEYDFTTLCQSGERRIFVAVRDGQICGYMEVGGEGETFLSSIKGTKNICGAYFNPVLRGTGAAAGLLSFIAERLFREGNRYLGVDCETINPAALRFWNKYFERYTYGYVRRMDERVLD